MRVAVDEGGHLGCEENIAVIISENFPLHTLILERKEWNQGLMSEYL